MNISLQIKLQSALFNCLKHSNDSRKNLIAPKSISFQSNNLVLFKEPDAEKLI